MSASLALGNLRAILILMVLTFHSILAYLGTLPPTAYRFDECAKARMFRCSF